jgi:hypothetical protein
MKICFTSYRIFADGLVTRPIEESDPANIAFALRGTYYSFFTLRNLSTRKLAELLVPFDLVFVALDVIAYDLVNRIIAVCPGRVATYSEGHVADYQRVAPKGQVAFLQSLRSAAIHFLYWEKYVPFYRTLTERPVEYLPYPYLLNQTHQFRIPVSERQSLVAVPTGLAGATRNGLASLNVAKKMIANKLVEQGACWLEAESFEEDYTALDYFFFDKPLSPPARQVFNWRRWLTVSNIDYRLLLQLRTRLRQGRTAVTLPVVVRKNNLVLFRRSEWSKYLAQLATARLVVDLNNRETVGRVALDCAALGIPCIGTNRSDMQMRLFPQTTLIDCWDIDGAIEISKKLLNDPLYYQSVIDYAAEAIKEFDVVPFRMRFASMMERHPEIQNGTLQSWSM